MIKIKIIIIFLFYFIGLIVTSSMQKQIIMKSDSPQLGLRDNELMINIEPKYLENDKQISVNIPIIMYHRVTSSNKKDRFMISVTDLENDLKYLENNGYETIIMNDLIQFVNYGFPIPEKPVLLTFDDGNYSDYKYLYPLLKKHQMQAVISIIGKPTDDYSIEGRNDINYPNLIWNQINKMIEDNVVEIQNHSYNMHGKNGSAKRLFEDADKYKNRFKVDVEKMQSRVEEMIGITPTTFTYPFGKISKESYDILIELGLLSSLSCYEGTNNVIQGQPNSLYLLNRYIRTPNRNIENILNKSLDQ